MRRARDINAATFTKLGWKVLVFNRNNRTEYMKHRNLSLPLRV